MVLGIRHLLGFFSNDAAFVSELAYHPDHMHIPATLVEKGHAAGSF